MKSRTGRRASKSQRFSDLVGVAKKLAEKARPNSLVALYRKLEAGRIDPEVADQKIEKGDVIVKGFMNSLMEEDWWRYRQLVAFIAWASLPKAGLESLASHARSFVAVEPPSVYEFVRFLPAAVARAKRLGVNLDEMFPDRPCEARGA